MRRVLLLALTCVFVSLRAQQFELGKVSKEELMQTAHPLEPGAPAAILFQSGQSYISHTDYGFALFTEVDVRIKIYKKDGYQWANKAIRYYIGDRRKEVVKFSKAVTYNLVNGEIEKTRLGDDGEFDEKTTKYWATKKIAMPNVKEGSVIEYHYYIASHFLDDVPLWRFQSSIPVNHSKFVTKFPDVYVFKTNFRGFTTPKISKSTQTKFYSYNFNDAAQYGATEISATQGSYTEVATTYQTDNMPSLKDEHFVNNIDNYVSSVEHELAIVKWPNRPVKDFSTSWEDIAKTIYKYDMFGEELKKTGYFEDDVKALTAGLMGNDQKTATIFNYVRDRMAWNGDMGYTCNEGVKKAYHDKMGNVAEINLMLVAMLRSVGLSANPVLVSTRDNGIAFFPSLSAYNYVICAVQDGDSVTLLDATDKSALPNVMPVRTLNWYGRIVRENGTSNEVDLMPKSPSKEVVNLVASVDAEGKVSGKVRDQLFDYNALVYRETFGKKAKDICLEKLEEKFKGIEIADDYTRANDDLAKPVSESFSFTHAAIAEAIGGKIYFSPMLFFSTTENPFKQDKREYPIDFVFPTQKKYLLTVNLPDGYTVESLPLPAVVNLGDGTCKFGFNITTNGKQIQVSSTVEVNEAIVAAEDYAALRDFYKAMIDKQNEKVVLKRI